MNKKTGGQRSMQGEAGRGAATDRMAGVETFADALLAGVEDATRSLAGSEAAGVEEFIECILEIGYGETVPKAVGDGGAAIYSRAPDAEALIYIINLKMGPVPTREEMLSRGRPERPAGLVRMPDTLRAKVAARLTLKRANRDAEAPERETDAGDGLPTRRPLTTRRQ